MKPIATSCSLPLSCLPYGFAFCSPRHRGSITEPSLLLLCESAVFYCSFAATMKSLLRTGWLQIPKETKLCRKSTLVCMYQRLESNVLWPIWLQKGANTHFLFSLTQKVKRIFSEIDDRLARATLLTLAGCWLACDLVSQGLQQKACCSSHLKNSR